MPLPAASSLDRDALSHCFGFLSRPDLNSAMLCCAHWSLAVCAMRSRAFDFVPAVDSVFRAEQFCRSKLAVRHVASLRLYPSFAVDSMDAARMADRLTALKSLDCYVLLHAPLVDWRLPASLTTLVLASGGLERDPLALANLMDCISRLSALQTLDIAQMCAADITPLVRMPRLTSLALFSADGQIEALRLCSSLLHLRFSAVSSLRALLPRLTQQPHQLQQLQHLELAPMAWTESIFSSVSRLPSLTTIHADWVPCSSNLRFLHSFEALTTLRCVLAHQAVGTADAEIEAHAQTLCEHLCRLPRLTALELSQAPLSTEHWTAILSRMHSLRSLAIRGPGLRLSSLRFLLDCGPHLSSSLTSFALESRSLSFGADEIEVICGLHQLRSLSLIRCIPRHAAMMASIDQLRPPSLRLPHLEELIL